MRPNKINILGISHSIKYVKKTSDVDIQGRDALLGQIDHFTHSIRVLDNGNKESIDRILIHEILHGITEILGIEALRGEENHSDLDRLAVLLADTLNRNKLLREQ